MSKNFFEFLCQNCTSTLNFCAKIIILFWISTPKSPKKNFDRKIQKEFFFFNFWTKNGILPQCDKSSFLLQSSKSQYLWCLRICCTFQNVYHLTQNLNYWVIYLSKTSKKLSAGLFVALPSSQMAVKLVVLSLSLSHNFLE